MTITQNPKRRPELVYIGVVYSLWHERFPYTNKSYTYMYHVRSTYDFIIVDTTEYSTSRYKRRPTRAEVDIDKFLFEKQGTYYILSSTATFIYYYTNSESLGIDTLIIKEKETSLWWNLIIMAQTDPSNQNSMHVHEVYQMAKEFFSNYVSNKVSRPWSKNAPPHRIAW